MIDLNAYRVRFDRGNTLLFRVAPDGRVGMRVLTREEWLVHLSKAAHGHPGSLVAEVGRQLFREAAAGEATARHMAAGRSYGKPQEPK